MEIHACTSSAFSKRPPSNRSRNACTSALCRASAATSSESASLIQPEPGTGLAYLDYEAQEFAIMAFLAGDHSMIGAYESGDPYIETAINLGLAPPGATKKNNKRLRSLVKMLLLAVQYGMSEAGLAQAPSGPLKRPVESKPQSRTPRP